MSKKAKVEKVKVPQTNIEQPKNKLDEQLTPEQYEQLAISLDEFQESLLSFLAGTAQFEVVPSTDDRGTPLSKENLELIKRECRRLGFKVLYSIDNRNSTLVVNPETMKVVVIPNQTEMH